ncbi:MAG: hypothetical protein M0D55_00510 [Elusimicrobiota bacterium]|nr:MAG: hypothetical protein M0D55_00510 [Elusimicrobiota bacterium]
MRPSVVLTLLFVTSASAADVKPNLLRVGSDVYTLSSASKGQGPVTVSKQDARDKARVFKNYRLGVAADGTISELANCAETALGPNCVEIETGGGKYMLPSLESLFIGDEKPWIAVMIRGKRTKIPLPMDAGRIRSVAATSGGIRLVVFAQKSLGRRSEGGREMFGVAHGGVYKIVEIAADAVKSESIAKTEPRP